MRKWVRGQAWSRLVPSSYIFPCNYADADDTKAGIKATTHSAILPHELFHTLFTFAPQLFAHILSGSDADLQEWWDGARMVGDEWYHDHPVINAQGDPLKRIPFGIHGDDAGVQGATQVLGITWGSLVRKLPTLDTRLAFTMVRTLDIVEGDTLDTIYSVFAWSLDALSQGEFPYNDHLGVPFSSIHHPDRFAKRGQKLADGRVGAFAGMRGDWKYLVEALHLLRFYKHHDYLCHACCVRKYANGMRYTDFRRCAPHRATILSNMELLSDLLGRRVISPYC